MELHFLADIISTISQNFLLKLKYFEECYDKHCYLIFHVSCKCRWSFVNKIFYVAPQKESHEGVKSRDRGGHRIYPYLPISIFHERCYWGIPSQCDENGVTHHLAATTFFCQIARSISSKSRQFILQERKVSFPI